VQEIRHAVSGQQEVFMSRWSVILLGVAACAVDPEPTAEVASALTASRDHVTADIYHYTFTVRVGSTPNAQLRIHRVVRELAPWRPRPTAHAAMLLHGDFSTFPTNFAPTLGDPASPAPGLAPFLAANGIDAWGLDRRWTLPGTDGDVSDFAGMSVAQEIDDVGHALAFARATRAVTDGDARPIVLAGFSHGAELAYAAASVDATHPPPLRHVSALVPIDIYYDIAPEDQPLRDAACESAAFERDLVAQGVTDADNSFIITEGTLARSAPDDPSPLFDGLTNRQAILFTVGQTYQFVPFTPLYHLLAPVLDGDAVTGLRETSEPAATAWFAGAPPHASMQEGADLDGIMCGGGPPLANISVPLFYLGAAGGFGDHGLYSTTHVSSTDVTTLVIRRFGGGREAEDFGHGDLIYAADAEALAWRPLASWILHH
jgi:hypothetical protein